MIYTIQGEQPFQVLSESFSVSPSESGYDLYLSADGFNYSQFATVASGVTRQFTSMNEGNYYKLIGNTSEVKVNWMKDCGGGGGGSAAGVSSLDGQTGALTTKTINGNAILGSGDIVISGGSAEQDYVIVEDLSAITTPIEGMVAFVKGTIAVDRMANVSGYEVQGWAGGMAQFVQGEDYTIHRNQVTEKWRLPYRTGTPDFTYYWTELDPGVYIRYQGGNLWVAWNSEDYPNATMMGNNFTDSDHKWGEDSGQTFYITLDHNEGFNIYRNGKWVPMKKQYWFQDCISSSALTEEICHRTAEGEMDITLVEYDGVMTCQYSSPNSWDVGSTAFVILRVDTNANHLQYFRKFVNWSTYNWGQDAKWDYTLPQSSSGFGTKPIFRDYWYLYYDTTTSGFSYGTDQSLTPITWGTGTTCSGMWIFDRDGMYQYLSSPTDVDKAFFFNLRVKTSEGTRIYGYPSFSRVELDTPVTLTDEQSESVTFSDKVYFDYGDCVLSFYFSSDWRFGGIEINFR